MFGEKWNRPYGEWSDSNPTINIWGAALRGLSMEQVMVGLDAVSNSGEKFVPTAPEFKKLCVGEKQHHEHIAIQHATREFNENQKRLAHKPINKEVGREHIEQMKKTLGRKL